MRLRLAAALGFCAMGLMACPGPIQSIPPPSPIGVEAAVNGAIAAEGKVRGQRCPRSAVARAGLTGVRIAFDSRYGAHMTADQRTRLDEARSDTDSACSSP